MPSKDGRLGQVQSAVFDSIIHSFAASSYQMQICGWQQMWVCARGRAQAACEPKCMWQHSGEHHKPAAELPNACICACVPVCASVCWLMCSTLCTLMLSSLSVHVISATCSCHTDSHLMLMLSSAQLVPDPCSTHKMLAVMACLQHAENLKGPRMDHLQKAAWSQASAASVCACAMQSPLTCQQANLQHQKQRASADKAAQQTLSQVVTALA